MLLEHDVVMQTFWNREKELAEIGPPSGKGRPRSRFGYVVGRRRIGKTALLIEACRRGDGFFHQAVEGTPQQQIPHLAQELSTILPIFRDIVPRNWIEFFRLLSRERLPRLMVFDEFPYWVAGDPTLPSILQKWIDHELPEKKTTLVVSGSSQSMLYSQFLRRDAPLFGRATFRIPLKQMSYAWFCKALGYQVRTPKSFMRFSLVGGVPYYWKLMPRGRLIEQVEKLYFSDSAMLVDEPTNWLRDEGIAGNLPKAIIDLIGRGASKPSELAARLAIPQGNLSRPLALLIDTGFIRREMPYGESTRTTKKVLYTLEDPALLFHYGTYLPLRAFWPTMTRGKKNEALRLHASRVFENYCRALHPGAGRYWEPDREIDIVAPVEAKKRYLVAECKFKELKSAEKKSLLADLETRFKATKLGRQLIPNARIDYRIYSLDSLSKLE